MTRGSFSSLQPAEGRSSFGRLFFFRSRYGWGELCSDFGVAGMRMRVIVSVRPRISCSRIAQRPRSLGTRTKQSPALKA